jgi:diaminopimelate decarboxylase
VDSVRSLIARLFPTSTGTLCASGVDVSKIADACGTPLFVYDRSIIDRNWDILRRAFPPEFSIFYSVKANPTQMILKCFLEKGAGLEIASAGEFWQALHVGCAPENIVFAGPGKSDEELRYVIGKGIGEIHVESSREARRISAITTATGVRARVALRVNPSGDAEGGAMRMGGRSSPFGVDEENLHDTVDELLSLDGLDFNGIHLFTGTQILDADILITQYRKGLEIARRVAKRIGHPLRTLDFGGGLGIPYFAHERQLDIDRLSEQLHSLWEGVRCDALLSGTRFLIEPGRYLAGECGIYVTRIIDIKVSRGRKFLIVDGGMNHHLAASGNLGQTIKRNYPVAVLNKLNEPADETVDVTGPLCTPLDVLARGVSLPQTEPGDLIGVFQSGAYARSASPSGFLSHRSPAEVWVDQGRYHLIRARGEYQDFLRDQISAIPAGVAAFHARG